MIQGKKLVVVMPAYNAEKTLRMTFDALPHENRGDQLSDEVFRGCFVDQLFKEREIRTRGSGYLHEISAGQKRNQEIFDIQDE